VWTRPRAKARRRLEYTERALAAWARCPDLATTEQEITEDHREAAEDRRETGDDVREADEVDNCLRRQTGNVGRLPDLRG
jgi:hypothetical protein